MKQVLAVGIAALLIAGALFLRNVLEDDDGGGGEGEGGGELVVACVRELREACEALDGVSELRIGDPAATIEAAAAGEIDAWVTFDPWPAIAAEQERRDVFAGEPVAVATTGIVLLARTASLPPECDRTVDWSCVAAATGSNAAALPSPTTAFGLLALGHAAIGWAAVELAGEPLTRAEIEDTPFQAWVGRIAFGGDPLEDMLLLGRAGPVATAATQARHATDVVPSRESANLSPAPTTAAASITVVVAGPRADRIAGQEAFLVALDELGYDRSAAPDAATVGLPSPGVLVALQELA